MKIVWARGWREGGGFVGPYPGKGRDLRVLMVKQDWKRKPLVRSLPHYRIPRHVTKRHRSNITPSTDHTFIQPTVTGGDSEPGTH